MSEPAAKIAKMTSCLDQLKEHTVVVADTGDFEGEEKSRASLESVGLTLSLKSMPLENLLHFLIELNHVIMFCVFLSFVFE